LQKNSAANNNHPLVTVIIPAKNEESNIGWVLGRLTSSVDQVILVDGHSVDDTINVARSVRPDIEVVVEDRPGKGAALRTGFAAARGDYVVMLDADGSMDPLEIPLFLQALRDGWDVVKGSRFLPTGGSTDISPIRTLGNWALLKIAERLFGFRQTDFCYGFIAFQRTALSALELTATGFEIEAQITVRAHLNGLRVTEVPSIEAPRRNGQSQLSPVRDGTRVLLALLRDRIGSRPTGQARPQAAPNGYRDAELRPVRSGTPDQHPVR